MSATHLSRCSTCFGLFLILPGKSVPCNMCVCLKIGYPYRSAGESSCSPLQVAFKGYIYIPIFSDTLKFIISSWFVISPLYPIHIPIISTWNGLKWSIVCYICVISLWKPDTEARARHGHDQNLGAILGGDGNQHRLLLKVKFKSSFERHFLKIVMFGLQ
jgi:hypothetical protein